MRLPHAAPLAAALVLPVLLLLLGGCSSVVSVPETGPSPQKQGASIEQRIVVLVHGDASYLYHDGEGNAHQADEETLREAFAAAQSMTRAEVFVFHQRPEDPLLGLFPRDDGTFYHFRRGHLIQQETYEQDRATPLAAEAARVRSHRAPVPDSGLFTAALYYGHAIPEEPRRGYHGSEPSISFGIESLAEGLHRLLPSGPLDAVVLSTCDGGTPPTIAAVAPHTQSVLAAPGDLHLSFVDADLLPTLPTTSDASAWTRAFAENAFDRLTTRVSTAVSLATYDVDRAAPAARRMARRVPPDTSSAPTGARHVDCRTVLGTDVDTTGVRVWHRPARFGPQANRDAHSGWGCVPPAAR